jgi:anthraniloyl-CoA monooxygenase
MMNILCIGGGPAGLYFSLLMKLEHPDCNITVLERSEKEADIGWGLVFSEETWSQLLQTDAKTATQISEQFYQWNTINVHFKNHCIESNGHAFSGIARNSFIRILQNRCRELGVNLIYDVAVNDVEVVAKQYDADIVIASDGVNSLIRQQFSSSFLPEIKRGRNRFIWLGTKKQFSTFCFAFVENEHGWFQAHAYQYDQDTSTFIIEMPEEVYLSIGLNKMNQPEILAYCEDLFAAYLDGQKLLMGNNQKSSPWQQFQRLTCQQWSHQLTIQDKKVPLILMGDAAHTVHFSIGSGTKLAIEDAIELARCLTDSLVQHSIENKKENVQKNVQENYLAAIKQYQLIRQLAVLKLQNAARNSMEWFEHVARYASFSAPQFTYSLLTRSQRIFHENLRMRDQQLMQNFELEFSKIAFENAGVVWNKKVIPPMFTPYKIRDLVLKNRVIVSPMAQYSAHDGCVDDYHLNHYLEFAKGGASLVIVEMTCVAADARITPRCAGLYMPEHIQAWKKITNAVHNESDAKIGVQLGHAGAKGSTRPLSEGADRQLESNNWPLISASEQQYLKDVLQVAKEASLDDLERVLQEFVNATLAANEAGFDWIELHCAHGYLLSSFISPLTNQRTDQYGGSIENRCRFPLEVFTAIREVWAQHKPISVRISANDWVEGGTTPEDAVVIASLFKKAGADMIDCSSGRVSKLEKPLYGRMYQTPYADAIRNKVHIPTIAVGGIFEADHVNSIIASGRADLCALGRPHLEDPAWTNHQAEKLGLSF